jgi:thymidine kinase
MKMKGRIEIICGGMFCGKTEELIRRLHRVRIAKQSVKVFKPSIDNRYHDTHVVSHSGIEIPAEVATVDEILSKSEGFSVIGIDEIQFFDSTIVDVVQALADQGKRVIGAGLDLDSNRVPFGPMPGLLCLAEDVTKLHAVCTSCGEDASYSYRTISGSSTVCVGGSEKYTALCRVCFVDKS